MSIIINEKHCFYPDRFEYLTPSQWGLSYSQLDIPGTGGIRLTGWHIPPADGVEPKGKTILHLHGNAQNMTAHLLGSYFLALEGFRLVTFDYRGYGRSTGEPTLEGIIDDGRNAVRYLFDNPPAPDEPLVLFGQSMGAFTAANLAPEFPMLDRIILEAGLISFRDLFNEAYPTAVNNVPEGFSTLEPLSKSEVPKLFIHGDSDSVVPLNHSKRMYEAAADPKKLIILEGVDHIDALDTDKAEEYREAIFDFLIEG